MIHPNIGSFSHSSTDRAIPETYLLSIISNHSIRSHPTLEKTEKSFDKSQFQFFLNFFKCYKIRYLDLPQLNQKNRELSNRFLVLYLLYNSNNHVAQ